MEYLKRFKKDEDFQFSLDNDKINSKYISYCDDDTHIHVAFKDRCGYLIYDFTNEKYFQAMQSSKFVMKINNHYHIALCKVGNENIFEQFKLISCKNSKYSLQEISSRIVYDVTNEVIAISLTDEENIIVSKGNYKKDAINIYKSFGELKFECKIKNNVFELPEEITLHRINVDDDSNLLIKDKVLINLSDMKDTIESFKPDIVFIDYFQLMTRDSKSEDIHVLNAYAKQYDIPIIVLSQISSVKFKPVDFNNTDLEEVKEIRPALAPIIDASDRFIVFYDNGNKEYLLKELKNSFGETNEFDIRDLLN